MTPFPYNFLIDPPNYVRLFALSSSSDIGLLLLEAERGLTWELDDLFCKRQEGAGGATAAEEPLQHILAVQRQPSSRNSNTQQQQWELFKEHLLVAR